MVYLGLHHLRIPKELIRICVGFSPLFPPSDCELLLTPTIVVTGSQGDYQINFARIIGQYIRDYKSPSIEDSVDYLCLVCLNGDLPPPHGPAQLALSHEALREIALETREFTKLLGDVKADGTRDKGAVEKRMKLIKIADQQEFLRTITEQAAAQADDDGRVSDAVLLYHLAEDYNTVVQVLNRSISDWIASEDPMQFNAHPNQFQHDNSIQSIMELDDPADLGKHMVHLYMSAVNMYRQISPRNREALVVLLTIAEAKKMYLNHEYDACLSVSCRSLMDFQDKEGGLGQQGCRKLTWPASGSKSKVWTLSQWNHEWKLVPSERQLRILEISTTRWLAMWACC